MTTQTTSRYERIQQALEAAFAPVSLQIVDESSKHASHVARTGVSGGETHYQVLMVSGALAGKSRLARQRAVNDTLAAEFKSGLHALSLVLRAPDEV